MVWVPVEFGLSSSCFNNYDLGIYGQAIHLLSLESLNPWLSVRDVFLFNDHFDPILFLTLPFKKLATPPLLAIRFEMVSLLLAAWAPFWLMRKKLISIEIAVCCAAIILFSPLTLDAAFYPSHPGTWSLAPLSWMFAFLLANQYWPSLLMLILMLACKEEYPFVGFAVGCVLWMRSERKFSAIYLAVSIAWALGVFLVRPALLGPASMYTEAVSRGHGLELLMGWDGISSIGWRLIELFLTILLLLSNRRPKTDKSPYLIPIAAMVVLLAIRFAGGYWGNHRAAPLAVAGAFMVPFVLRTASLSPSRLRMFALCMVVLAFPSLELGARFWRGKPFKNHCPATAGRIESIMLAQKELRSLPGGILLAQGNLVPQLVDLPGIAHLGATHSKDFRYLLIEKGEFRNTWPLSKTEFEETERKWLQFPGIKKIIEDQNVLLIDRTPSN